MSARPRWWPWIAATVACGGVLALATVPAVLLSTAAGGCDVGYQPGGSGSGSWVATAYGPPWGGIQGDGITATGIDLRSGRAMLEVAVDPQLIALRSFVHVDPNPFGTSGAFYAGDTGGAIVGRHVDIYDWQGRAAQEAWGARSATPRPPERGGGRSRARADAAERSSTA
ncbi:MAG: 3D domain-containing protein [Solirubrobacteraceae bacterium]